MSENIKTITYYNNKGDEITEELPAKFEVCHKCDGHGTHLTPSIGNHAYSQEEFYESFETPEDRAEYFRRGGIYDVTCEVCKGKRVEQVIDENRCTTEEQKRILKEYKQHLQNEAEWRAEERAEQRREAMMLGVYDG